MSETKIAGLKYAPQTCRYISKKSNIPVERLYLTAKVNPKHYVSDERLSMYRCLEKLEKQFTECYTEFKKEILRQDKLENDRLEKRKKTDIIVDDDSELDEVEEMPEEEQVREPSEPRDFRRH